jgi:GxxExxY protein
VLLKFYNTPGYGFLEKVYERAMMIEMRLNGIPAISQKPIQVFYKDEIVGDYCADILIVDRVLIELKAAESLKKDHELQ